jgi:hypothetical protein
MTKTGLASWATFHYCQLTNKENKMGDDKKPVELREVSGDRYGDGDPELPPGPCMWCVTNEGFLRHAGVETDILEKLAILATAWGISPISALSVSISDAYDNKVGALRDAEGQ